MEDVLAGIKAYFVAQLAPQLVAIGVERGVSVPPWALIDTAVIRDRQYPSVEILPRAVEFDYEAANNARLPPLEDHLVTVRVKQQGSEPKAVQNDLMRYGEGIRRVTSADYSYGSRFKLVRLEGTSFAEFADSQAGELLQELVVDLRVQVQRWRT